MTYGSIYQKQLTDRLDLIIELLSTQNTELICNNNTEKQDMEHKHVLIQFDLVKSQIACLESKLDEILDKLEELKK